MKCTDNILTYKSSDGMNIQANIAHMQQHLDSLPFIQEALDKINTKNQEFVKVEIDLGRVIGTTTLVKTTDSDEIVFAIRNDRRILSRFVKNREGQPCQTIVIILRKLEGIRYKLLTAYIGRLAEKEAGDHSIMTESEYATCKAFWNEHALLWDESSVKYIAFPGEEEKLPKPIYELRKQMVQAA